MNNEWSYEVWHFIRRTEGINKPKKKTFTSLRKFISESDKPLLQSF